MGFQIELSSFLIWSGVRIITLDAKRNWGQVGWKNDVTMGVTSCSV